VAPKKSSVDVTTSTTKTTNTAAPLDTKILEDVIKALRSNKLWIKDPVARQRYPEVVDFASQLITHKRHSDMDEISQQEALESQVDYGPTNEATFVAEMWRHMHKDYRDKRTSGEPGSDILDADWTTETWHKAHLNARWDREFRPESIPRVDTKNATIIKLLQALPRVKNPKPDLAYGIKHRALTQTELDVANAHLRFSEPSPGLCFPFFAAEFKGAGGVPEEVELQACRVGAAMVDAIRGLNKFAGLEKKDAGADMSSFAFTLTMIPSSARMQVHWAQIVPGEPNIYHMHTIGRYWLDIGRDYKDIRRDLNNILDWGLSVRLQHVKETLNAINKKNVAAPPPKTQNTGTEASEKGDAGVEQGSVG